MLLNIILIIDLALLAVVIGVYFRYSFRERGLLRAQLVQGRALRFQAYLSEVQREVEERVGYAYDPVKFFEVVSSSLGNLFSVDAAAFLVRWEEKMVYRCRIEHPVNHKFLENLKTKVGVSYETLSRSRLAWSEVDQSITGALLDDNLKILEEDYFCVPVFLSGELTGVIAVGFQKRGRYSLDEASVLFSTITQAAATLTKLQKILENERGKLVSIINSMTDGVVVVDSGMQVQVANQAINQLLEMKTQKPADIYSLVDSLAGKVDIRTYLEQATKSHAPIKLPAIRLNFHTLEATITPVRTSTEEKPGAALVFHDITTEKELENLKQDYTTMMVHELRAPLTAVRWSAETINKELKQEALDHEKVGQASQSILSASSGMLELVSDFLDMAKLEAGKFELNFQEVDLVALLRDKLSVFQTLAAQKGLELKSSLPVKLSIVCDRVRIGQVINNFLSNALKYTDSGEVEVGLNTDLAKNLAIVSVKDSGIGVNREDLPHLFSKFRRLHRLESTKPGTGLGLVISKGIIEAHSGQIWAESAGENLGTTFYFGLPLSGRKF